MWVDLDTGDLATVRLMYPPCFYRGSKLIARFCPNDSCCIHDYKILFRPNLLNLIVEHREIIGYQDTCLIFQERRCNNVCTVKATSQVPIILEAEGNNNGRETKIVIYPNPANEIINLELNNFFGEKYKDLIIEIFTSYGESVFKSYLHANKAKSIPIKISNLSSGLYLLILKNSGGEIFRSLFIKI